MAFYGSIKAFINFGKLLYLPILSSPCREVELFMWLPIGCVDCVLKGTSRALCFSWQLGERWEAKARGYGHPGGPHSKGPMEPVGWGRRHHSRQGNFGPTSLPWGKGQWSLTVSPLQTCLHVYVLTYMHVCLLFHHGFLLMLLNMKIKCCFCSAPGWRHAFQHAASLLFWIPSLLHMLLK